MKRTQVNLSYALLVVALSASLLYRPVVAADPAVPAAKDQVPASADAALDPLRSDFDALIKDIVAQQPAPSADAGAAAGAGTPDQLHAANIQIGILQQAVVAALAARAEAEAQLETLWRDSRAEIEGLKAAQAEDATRISELESALAEADGAVLASAEDGAVEAAAFAPADAAVANGPATDDELASIAPASGPTEMMLGEIHFNPGSADLTPGARRKTLEAAERMKGLAVSNIRIAGYTDTLGPAAFNKHLSLQRAQSIAKLLSSVGVSSEIIELEGNGEDGAPEATADQVSEPLNRCAGIFAMAELPAAPAQ
jgi:outer membrane protein OmpA-like peptidoglycan-associated protein